MIKSEGGRPILSSQKSTEMVVNDNCLRNYEQFDKPHFTK